MLAAVIPANDAQRLLHGPISVISILEQDEQWFRLVKGLDVDHTPRDVSFCGHAIALNKPLRIPDIWDDPSSKLTAPKATIKQPDSQISLALPLSISVSWLADMGPNAGPEAMWA